MREKSEKDDEQEDALTETMLDSKLVYKGGFFDVYKDTIRLPDGGEATREYIRHPGAVVILPLFEDRTVLVEKQFRYPLHRVFVEFPAGKIDRGEDTLASAKRELEEETGYTASDWRYVTTIHNAIGYSDERLLVYLAQGLKAGTAHCDEEEFIQTCKMPLEELVRWVKEGKVSDVKTVIGTFWLEKIVSGQWDAEKVL